MHAFLMVGGSENTLEAELKLLSKRLGAKIIEYPIAKIGDVRNLNNLIRLSFATPTLIYCKNIHKTGEEAANAFLKNLEEPQENIYFALTSPSLRKVLPTIASRCEIIRLHSQKTEAIFVSEPEIEKFLKMPVGEKLNYVSKIKNREDAIKFVENMVFFMHGTLHTEDVKYICRAEEINLAVKTLSGLNANGNVNLQLSNLAIQMSDSISEK